MANTRAEADAAVERAEAAEKRVKVLEQELMSKDQEIISLNHRLSLLDTEVDKYEARLSEAKGMKDHAESGQLLNENLSRKVQLLEEELDAAEKNNKDTVEKYVQQCCY